MTREERLERLGLTHLADRPKELQFVLEEALARGEGPPPALDPDTAFLVRLELDILRNPPEPTLIREERSAPFGRQPMESQEQRQARLERSLKRLGLHHLKDRPEELKEALPLALWKLYQSLPEPKPTQPPTPHELPLDSPYRQRPGETVQHYLQRVPGPVKILRVDVSKKEPLSTKPRRHLWLVPPLEQGRSGSEKEGA